MKVYGLAAVLALMLMTIGCGHSNHFLYTVGPKTNSVLGFKQASDGVITGLSSGFSTDAEPVSLFIHPSGQFAFTANFSGGNVSLFTVDTQKGTFRAATDPTSGSLLGPITAGNNPIVVGGTTNGQFLYVLNQGTPVPNPPPTGPPLFAGTISAFTVNTADGNLVPLTNNATFPTGGVGRVVAMAIAPNSKFLYIADVVQGTIAGFLISSGGVLTAMPGSPFTAGPNPAFIAIDPEARFLYVADNGTNQIFGLTIDPNTGALSPISGSPFAAGSKPVSLAIDSAGVFLVAANQGSNNISAYSITRTTGALSPVSGSPFATSTAPVFVTVDATNSFVYVAGSVSNDIVGFAINQGALKSITGSPFPVATSPGWLASR
jgi:6-phosphogluconolactonase (cycloisomerase 2 family)